MDPSCRVCADPNRYSVEQTYLESGSGRDTPYTRQEIERHMSHVADPRALRLVTDLANASAVAGRLRALETMAAQIMDAAINPPDILLDGVVIKQQPDLKVALAALREARATIHEMSQITETLSGQNEQAEERPDIDDAISEYLKGKSIGDLGDNQTQTEAQRADNTYGPLAIEAPAPVE